MIESITFCNTGKLNKFGELTGEWELTGIANTWEEPNSISLYMLSPENSEM